MDWDVSDGSDKRKAAPPPVNTFREWLGGPSKKIPAPADPQESEVVLGEGCASLPERLPLAHAKGEVLFLAGAGVSMPKPACLPSFTELVLKVYRQLGDPLLPFLEALEGKEVELPQGPPLTPDQNAEAKSFEKKQLDVVLGMLERHALGAIPRPSLRPSFSGVLHLHGALRPEGNGIPDLILTNRDFGEFYLRRRVVPDLLYDAARIFNLVLVGYTASDPPVRYLLGAISADDARFRDLKVLATLGK